MLFYELAMLKSSTGDSCLCKQRYFHKEHSRAILLEKELYTKIYNIWFKRIRKKRLEQRDFWSCILLEDYPLWNRIPFSHQKPGNYPYCSLMTAWYSMKSMLYSFCRPKDCETVTKKSTLSMISQEASAFAGSLVLASS